MDYFVDVAMGESIGESAKADLLRPVEQFERFGLAAAAPSPGKCTYVFVPAVSGDTADALASEEFGAFLRLGSYSDIEEAARDFRPQADHYPGHHLRHEGGPAAALSQASGGRQGIMLACDGRVLLRSKEKMYVDTGDYHQSSSGNYDLEVDGTMRLATTGSPGGVTISSEQDTLTLESGPDQDITLSAGDGTGDINWRVKTSTKVFDGNEYTVVTGGHHRVAHTRTVSIFGGFACTVTLSPNLYMNGGADVFLRMGLYLDSIHSIDARVIYNDVTKYARGWRDFFCCTRGIVCETTMLESETSNVSFRLNHSMAVDSDDTSTTDTDVGTQTSIVKSIKGDLESHTNSVTNHI